MPQSIPSPYSGSISLTVIPLENGCCVCEVTSSLGGRTGPTKRFHGQTPNHALAVGLEDMARMFRKQAEVEQKIEWDTVERSATGTVNNKCFHVILHYECVAEEESKFAARHNTMLGNTVVENAEITLVQVDPDLPMEPI